ncbi:type II toxin-antitoxin system VapC family toxin [Streptomyces scopuliridis]|uniref:type II toxin-antitoxin system VapC family toxin n=1 Tax=Streptomyces scopuliridis TaxID=452529 RepID=UPI00369A196B
MVTSPTPGEGPVRPVSVSLHEGTIAALKARTGKRGMSAYVEARGPRTSQARFDYAVSRVNIIPPTEAVARRASELLAAAGLHGHKYALDVIVAATALASPAPVTVLTSDPEDLHMLCGPGIRVIKI